MRVEIVSEKVEKVIRAAKCLESPVTQEVIRRMVEEVLANAGISDDLEYDITPVINQWGVLTDFVSFNREELYDHLMSSKHAGVSSSEISEYIVKEMEFVTHGVKARISFALACPLPEDDYRTLDMIGKIHRSYKAGYMEESVYCAR